MQNVKLLTRKEYSPDFILYFCKKRLPMLFEELKQRRTIRKYTGEDSPEKLLNELIETACRVSTTGNMQLYSIIITRDKEMKEKLAPAHFNQPTVTSAPVVLTFCADFNRFIKWCDWRDAQQGYDNFQSFFTAAIDALIFAQQFCTVAELAGLGICYLGTTTYNAPQIIETLQLPKYVIPVTTITVGYPSEIPEQVERLPLEAIIHQEKYKDYTREDIDRLYRDKESLATNLKFIKENNKKTLAQVFTDVRYKKEDNEYFSEVFLKIIKEQGFRF